MSRFFFKLIICLLLAGAAGLVYLSMKSGDPLYALYEFISPARFHQHDALIRAVAAEHQLDPMLVKAVVWRESRFDAQKFGTAGERGLMQVSEKAAGEWARETKVENFRVEELFDPKTNLEAGTWYLRRAIELTCNFSRSALIFFAPNPGSEKSSRMSAGNSPRNSSKNFNEPVSTSSLIFAAIALPIPGIFSRTSSLARSAIFPPQVSSERAALT